ncbi:MAG: redoxin domain-containing protein [Thermoplasmata archaeon]
MNEPDVGEKAPGFSLLDTERKPRTLDEFLGKNLVVAFYPGAFTSVCTKEMCAFRDSIARLEELDSGVAGISVNDPFTNAAFAERNAINFPLLSDYKREAAEAFGVSLESFAGMSGYTAAKRSIFIVDKQGIVRYKWVTEDQGVEPDYEEIQGVLAEIG